MNFLIFCGFLLIYLGFVSLILRLLGANKHGNCQIVDRNGRRGERVC